MSTDQRTEVSSEESGLVPPQSEPKQEWPKKIRTLTTGELDRLTIDADGRFYWDGKLVNYTPPASETPDDPPPQAEGSEPPSPPAAPARQEPLDPFDQAALEILDQAAQELSGPNPTEPRIDSRPVEPTVSVERTIAAVETVPAPTPSVASEAALAGSAALATAVAASAANRPNPPLDVQFAQVIRPDKVRIRLSFFQSLILLLALIGLLVAAAGIAAQGWVAAHSWSCRVGLTGSYCPPPPPPPPAPPQRPDIPA